MQIHNEKNKYFSSDINFCIFLCELYASRNTNITGNGIKHMHLQKFGDDY